jgi:hypothetical protein
MAAPLDLNVVHEKLDSALSIFDNDLEPRAWLASWRDDFANADRTLEARKVQVEMDCLNFTLKDDGKLSYRFGGTNEAGEKQEYPQVNSFTESDLDYLEQRFQTANSMQLKTRYAHVLWSSKRKHNKYGNFLVESYLELSKQYEALDGQKPKEHHSHQVLLCLSAAFYIAAEFRPKNNPAIAPILKAVESYPYASESCFFLRLYLVKIMIVHRGRFGRTGMETAVNACWGMAEHLILEKNLDGAISMLESGAKIDSFLDTKNQKWNRCIAECYERLMEGRSKEDLAAISFCQSAMDCYKSLKDKKKVKALEQKFIELKKERKFGTFNQSYDISDHVRYCQNLAEKVAGRKAEEIITTLTMDKSFLPELAEMKRRVAEQAEVAPFQHLMGKQMIDRRGNPAQSFNSEAEKEYYGVLQNYEWELNMKKWLIDSVILKSVLAGKLTCNSVVEFLSKHSWLGQTLERGTINGGTEEVLWLKLLAPGLYSYFQQLNAFCQSTKQVNYVLAIESLTLKFEGLLREMCDCAGVPTFNQTKDKSGRKVVREKDIHALLYEPFIAEMFDADDLLFFRFLFVEKAGYNLRHDIAHCFVRYEEYDLSMANLVFLAILKVAKYKLVSRPPEDDPTEGGVPQE